MSALKGGNAVLLLLVFSVCNSTPDPSGADIVRDSFPDAQAEIAAAREACTKAAMTRDWDALRSFHLQSPKFSKITNKGVRYDFDQMIAEEIAVVSAMLDAMPDLEADLRDQKIDVFGDTAVETAFLVGTGTLPNGDVMEIRVGVSAVWVLTDAGWKIAHEQGTPANDIVMDPYHEVQAAVRAEVLRLSEYLEKRDWDALRDGHLDSPKFTKFARRKIERKDYQETIADELRFSEVLNAGATISFDDLKVDVFGDVAVATTYTNTTVKRDGAVRDRRRGRLTLIYVRTPEGWKISHEHASPGEDFIRHSYPEAQEAIRAEMSALQEIGRGRDWEALRAAHLEGPKFTEFADGIQRNDSEAMLAREIAGLSALEDLSIDWRELKIDVFGDVAVATAFPLYTGTSADGEKIEIERRATMIYVKTPDGWKIAHEHLSKAETE